MTVIAKDQGKPPRQAFVTVAVLVEFKTAGGKNNTNKNPIFEPRTYTGLVQQGSPRGTNILTVHAYDPDYLEHKTIRYYIKSSSETGVFTIDSNRGIIKTAGELTKFIYHLEIVAKYAGEPFQQDDGKNTATVTIHVRTVDKTRPYFMNLFYEAKIPENATVNTKVGIFFVLIFDALS